MLEDGGGGGGGGRLERARIRLEAFQESFVLLLERNEPTIVHPDAVWYLNDQPMNKVHHEPFVLLHGHVVTEGTPNRLRGWARIMAHPPVVVVASDGTTAPHQDGRDGRQTTTTTTTYSLVEGVMEVDGALWTIVPTHKYQRLRRAQDAPLAKRDLQTPLMIYRESDRERPSSPSPPTTGGGGGGGVADEHQHVQSCGADDLPYNREQIRKMDRSPTTPLTAGGGLDGKMTRSRRAPQGCPGSKKIIYMVSGRGRGGRLCVCVCVCVCGGY